LQLNPHLIVICICGGELLGCIAPSFNNAESHCQWKHQFLACCHIIHFEIYACSMHAKHTKFLCPCYPSKFHLPVCYIKAVSVLKPNMHAHAAEESLCFCLNTVFTLHTTMLAVFTTLLLVCTLVHNGASKPSSPTSATSKGLCRY